MDSAHSFLRAVVPVTEFVQTSSIKYYVACHPVDNVCSTRLISSDCIFYLPEMWSDMPAKADIKTRRSKLGAACKLHAAKRKGGLENDNARTSLLDSRTPTMSKTLGITREKNAAGLPWDITRKEDALQGLRDNLKDVMPGISKRPSNQATAAFYNFEAPMGQDDAVRLTDEVKVGVVHRYSLHSTNICHRPATPPSVRSMHSSSLSFTPR